jgi:hypothetical protein
MTLYTVIFIISVASSYRIYDANHICLVSFFGFIVTAAKFRQGFIVRAVVVADRYRYSREITK